MPTTWKFSHAAAILTSDEMGEADRLTIAGGTPGWTLMQRAGRAVADTVLTRYPQARNIALLAGPGNNGGDAYVVAARLGETGRGVTVFSLGDVGKLKGDVAAAAEAYDGPTWSIEDFDPTDFDLVIDGLFGAGLARPIEGEAAAAIARVNGCGLAVIAIDLPSGVSGSSGNVLGSAIQADSTVTFFRRKPGHLLQPGRGRCGMLIVADIGIAPRVLDAIAPMHFANEPALWAWQLGLPSQSGHKFDRGHAVVFSGGATQTGAARLAANAALRGGAGLVTLLAPGSALMVNAAHLTAVMLKRCDGNEDLDRLLEDDRMNAFVLGPGFGIGEDTRVYALAVLGKGRSLVLDADGISSFKNDAGRLFDAARAAAGTATSKTPMRGQQQDSELEAEFKASKGREVALILTPHAGEFARLFPDLADDECLSKTERARRASKRACAIVILKGSDTVIAAPDGRVAINANGTPWLATAGSGDVLSGIIAAQLAQAISSFEAACIGVWMHARAAELFGPGLIAEDLPGLMPQVLGEMVALAP